MTINLHFLPTLCAMVLLADIAPAPGCSSRSGGRPPGPPANVTPVKTAIAKPATATEAPKPATA